MDRQSGNVLFLILIAVALFAALSFAITTSTRGSGNSGSKEKIKASVALAQEQGLDYRTAVQRMMYGGGITEDQLEFVNSGWNPYLNQTTYYDHANCTTTQCRVFNSAGGGGIYVLPPSDLSGNCKKSCPEYQTSDPYWLFGSDVFIPGIGQDDKADLIAYFRVTKADCILINDALGITNPSGQPPILPGNLAIFTANFLGTYSTNYTSATTFPSALAGKDVGCVNQNHSYYSGDHAYFYYVLLPR